MSFYVWKYSNKPLARPVELGMYKTHRMVQFKSLYMIWIGVQPFDGHILTSEV